MKLLPCDTRNCGDAQTKSGKPMLVGRLIDNVTTYKCWKCKRTTKLSSARWTRLPDAPPDVVRAIFPSALDNNTQ